MGIQCVLCGHEDPVEIVNHINEKHDGLRKYQLFFPSSNVVSHELFTAIENAVHFKFTDKDQSGLDRIKESDRQLLIENMRRQMVEHSVVLSTEDF